MQHKFPAAFGDYACIDDYIDVEVNGILYRATVEHDYDSRPEDTDCYTPEQLQAWRDDKWHYCGIVISIWLDDIQLAPNAASLWGVERNFPDGDNTYMTEVANELLGEAITYATQRIPYIRDKLNQALNPH